MKTLKDYRAALEAATVRFPGGTGFFEHLAESGHWHGYVSASLDVETHGQEAVSSFIKGLPGLLGSLSEAAPGAEVRVDEHVWTTYPNRENGLVRLSPSGHGHSKSPKGPDQVLKSIQWWVARSPKPVKVVVSVEFHPGGDWNNPAVS